MTYVLKRIGIKLPNQGDTYHYVLYVEYFNENDDRDYVREIKLSQDLLHIQALIKYLNDNQRDLFGDDIIEKLQGSLNQLIDSINDYQREKILKLGNEEEIEAEKQKMNEIFKKNVISASDPNYEYDKRISFDMEESDKIENEWDSD